jgi:superfamily II DNA or RNA helicase
MEVPFGSEIQGHEPQVSDRVRLRDEIWRVESHVATGGRTLYQLRSDETGQRLTAIAPPDAVEVLAGVGLELDRRSLSPFGIWQLRHELIQLTTAWDGLAAIHSGRVQLEPYQLVPVTKILNGPHRNLLIADDVGLGKTIEAGLCIVELSARRVGQRVLLVVPPGLIDQWLEEMHGKFGLAFKNIADSACLDQAQTELAEGISPWAFHDRIITSTEYLKRPGVHSAALRRPWDIIVVDEAHYLAESGSPANPYSTRRTSLGLELRKATRSLLLLTATPHNGYRHSFRSLLELIEPTDATLEGDVATVRRRVARSMVRRLKQQITRAGPDGSRVPAFVPRAPVERFEVHCATENEREIFRLVTRYCNRTAEAAEGSEQRDLVSFAMQIVKKRMLSSRLALGRTIENRLDALRHAPDDAGPTRGELRELQEDLPLPEQQAERLASRVLRSAVPPDERRRNAEKRQLREIQRTLQRIADCPDPKIARLVADLRATVIDAPDEKAIVFTEYLDTLEAVHEALIVDPAFAGRFAELPGGLAPRQRRDRIAEFETPECRVLLATDAASEGLNLQQFCRRLYHVELPWNPNRLEQRNGRIDRYGQQRTPQIAYLFYSDSPEDRVLDRLVTRISQMQGDRVSTPDIVGIVEAIRLPDRLLAIGPDDDGEGTAESLVRVFDEEHSVFLRDVAPVLAGSEAGHTLADATSADPVLEDDIALERAMLSSLGTGARPSGRAHEYSVTVPSALQGPGVVDRYPSLTFRRSAAVADGAAGTEFAHRLHPLARAAGVHAREQLGSASPGVTMPPYLTVRRLGETLNMPAAVFTFTDRAQHPDGVIVAVGVGIDGSEMSESELALALAASERPGDVPWADCERTFNDLFQGLRTRAQELVMAKLHSRIASERDSHSRLAAELRAEVEAYRADRIRELEQEEAAERLGTRDQADLFRESRTDWAARRAAVATQADARLARIAEWEKVPEAASPEPLGVLLVFPGGEG